MWESEELVWFWWSFLGREHVFWVFFLHYITIIKLASGSFILIAYLHPCFGMCTWGRAYVSLEDRHSLIWGLLQFKQLNSLN